MKISLTGSHSVGKTTILNKLRNILPNYKFIEESSRYLKEKGIIKLNEDSNNLTQLMTTNENLRDLIFNLDEPNVVFDRCLLDAYAYTKWLYIHLTSRLEKPGIDGRIYTYNHFLLEEYLNCYDIIFYLPIEFPMEEDGVRSNFEGFREGIDDIVSNCVKGYSESKNYNTKFVTLTGTVEERINKILENLK